MKWYKIPFVILIALYFLPPVILFAQMPFELNAKINRKGKCINGIYFDGERHYKISPPCDLFGDTLYSFPAPGTFPCGLTWDGQYFWNSDADSQRIYKLSSNGTVDTSFTLPQGVYGADLEWDGTFLWMVDEQDAKLYKLDPATGLPLQSFDLPDSASPDPNSWGLTWDGSYLWHSQYGTQAQIFKIDPSNGIVLFSFIPLKQFILGIAWYDNYLYGIDIGSMTCYKMNPSNGFVVDSIRWQVPYPLGLVFVGSYLWNVSSAIRYGGNQRIYKIDAGVGIEETSLLKLALLSKIEIYPNPARSFFIIHCPQSLRSAQGDKIVVKIFDVSGKVVKEIASATPRNDDVVRVSLDRIMNGVYFVKVGDEMIKEKLIVTK